jgi:hypothetical protein
MSRAIWGTRTIGSLPRSSVQHTVCTAMFETKTSAVFPRSLCMFHYGTCLPYPLRHSLNDCFYRSTLFLVRYELNLYIKCWLVLVFKALINIAINLNKSQNNYVPVLNLLNLVNPFGSCGIVTRVSCGCHI